MLRRNSPFFCLKNIARCLMEVKHSSGEKYHNTFGPVQTKFHLFGNSFTLCVFEHFQKNVMTFTEFTLCVSPFLNHASMNGSCFADKKHTHTQVGWGSENISRVRWTARGACTGSEMCLDREYGAPCKTRLGFNRLHMSRYISGPSPEITSSPTCRNTINPSRAESMDSFSEKSIRADF